MCKHAECFGLPYPPPEPVARLKLSSLGNAHQSPPFNDDAPLLIDVAVAAVNVNEQRRYQRGDAEELES
jgi:hypothetical protein